MPLLLMPDATARHVSLLMLMPLAAAIDAAYA